MGGTITAHSLYQRARDDAGNFVRLSWPVYLLLTSLYEDLPQRYKEAIATKYGSSAIEDHTIIYRHFYPTPTPTIEQSLTGSTIAQAPQNALTREIPGNSTQTDTHKSIKSEDEEKFETNLVEKDRHDVHLENRDSSSAALGIAPSQTPWSIDNIIDALAVSKNKRSSSASESSSKRTKLGDDEILNHINQHTEAIHKIIHEAQLEQHSKLQEIHHGVEKTAQILTGVQNDLRQFMSAVASALKDIQEHFNE